MPDLRFTIEGIEPAKNVGAPVLNLRVRVSNSPADEAIHSIALRCQVQIEPARRKYSSAEQGALADLFGEPQRWGSTVRPLLWSNVQAAVPAFSQSTVIELPVPCSPDANAGATKYFYGLQDGEVPILLLFSGTVFYASSERPLQIAPIPWDREASYRMPVAVWKELMEPHDVTRSAHVADAVAESGR
jgi:Family of unknown function (DUF6084)